MVAFQGSYVELRPISDKVSMLLLVSNPSNKANVFNNSVIKEFHECFDILEQTRGPRSLIISSEDPKFFSAGFDLSIMRSSPEAAGKLVTLFWRMLGRLFELGIPTICAINGHAFGAGAFIALSCDHVLMVSGNSRFCLPEITIGLPLSIGFAEIVKSKLPAHTRRIAALSGKRWSAEEATIGGIADKVFNSFDSLFKGAVVLAENLAVIGKSRDVVTLVRRDLYGETIDVLKTKLAIGISKL